MSSRPESIEVPYNAPDMIPVEKKDTDTDENYMLVMEDQTNIAHILDIEKHEFKSTHRIVHFSRDIREVLATGDLPIIMRFG